MASSYSFICARTRGSTISTPPRCDGGVGKAFFFLDLEALLEEALDRPEELEEVFCTFAMARMLAEALPHVNAAARGMSSLFRNVPFLTSLEVSLFFDLLLSLGCPPERSPAPRFVRRV